MPEAGWRMLVTIFLLSRATGPRRHRRHWRCRRSSACSSRSGCFFSFFRPMSRGPEGLGEFQLLGLGQRLIAEASTAYVSMARLISPIVPPRRAGSRQIHASGLADEGPVQLPDREGSWFFSSHGGGQPRLRVPPSVRPQPIAGHPQLESGSQDIPRRERIPAVIARPATVLVHSGKTEISRPAANRIGRGQVLSPAENTSCGPRTRRQ